VKRVKPDLTPSTVEVSHTELEIVVIGSSAGGIEALSTLVSTLPADFPSPIVLAQHLDPDHASNLGSILQRHTTLKVEVVTFRSAMKPSTIYVVPSNNNVVISDGHVEVQEGPRKRPYPSVDLLLATAAAAYGERLIAVILTGAGSDGAAGSIAVKQAGGTVIIQNPETARYPSMPLSLPPTIVDFQCDIEQIGSLLGNLLAHIQVAVSNDKTIDTLQNILDQIRSHTKFDFRKYKTPTIIRRITRRMLALHIDTMLEYAHYVEQHADEVSKLVNAFLINVTHFFRDPTVFAYLKSDLLPQLIEEAREQGRVLRFWSAGCSTGEEPYSLIMLLADLLGAEFSQWNIRIFATDLDESAIVFARHGIYSVDLLKGVSADYQSRFFEPVDQGFRISKTLRQAVTFGEHDLSQSGPFSNINLLLCRNVLIYFSRSLQEDLLRRFTFSLRVGGYLVLGKSETTGKEIGQYELVNVPYKVYQCSSMARLSPRRIDETMRKLLESVKQTIPEVVSPVTPRLTAKAALDADELMDLRHLNDTMLRFLPMGIITINADYRIITANTMVRRLLGIAEIGFEQDFLHAVRGVPYNETRKAIDAAFREHKMVTLADIELDPKAGGNGRFITFNISVIQEKIGAVEMAAVSVTDVTEHVQLKQQLRTSQAEQARMVGDLQLVNESLNLRNQELLDANEKLHISNEDFGLLHEQLEASLEEFETTNEELQATNEELETTNEEMQATNEELQMLNTEVEARNAEIVALTDGLASEHAVVKEIVDLAPYYIMVLRGPNLNVQAFNTHYVPLLHGEPIYGKPLEQVAHLFWVTGTAVTTLARDAYQQDTTINTGKILMRFTDEQGEPSQRYIVSTIVPSHDPDGKIYGLVIYTDDVTEQRVREIQDELERLRLIFNHIEKVAFALYDAQTAKILLASSGYLAEVDHNLGLTPDKVIGQHWLNSAFFIPPEHGAESWETVLKTREPVLIPEVQYSDGDRQSERIWNALLLPIIYPDEPESVRFILFSAVDITEQVHARQVLEQSNQMKIKFLGMISHELRTPLASIQGFASTLLATDVSWEPAEQHDFLLTIEEESNKLAHLVGDLLDLSSLESGKLGVQIESKSISELVDTAWPQLQAVTPHHDLVIGSFADLPLVSMDVQRIAQVLVNLVSNAAKYSPQHTRIAVSFTHVEDTVQFDVSDQGPGIEAAYRKQVFEPFLQLKSNGNIKQGVGLGLSICKALVEAHNGRIWIADKSEPGTTISFTLPAVNSP